MSTVLDDLLNDTVDLLTKMNACHLPAGPRGGQFCSGRSGPKMAPDKGGGAGGGTASKKPIKRFGKRMVPVTRDKSGKLVLEGRKPLPAHLAKLRIPPAWSEVKVSLDPKAALIAKGKDAKGRDQSIYSASHHLARAAKKFAKNVEMRQKEKTIVGQIKKAMGKSETKEQAIVTSILHQTGARIGSNRETLAAKKAYGISTLEARHVVINKSGVTLKFVGKKGVDNSYRVTDKSLARELAARKKKLGPRDRLFKTSDNEVRKFVGSLGGGKFSPKDFRTMKATKMAIDIVGSMKKPKTVTEYKRSIKEVAIKVSRQLNNNPAQALQSYIDPTVFAGWRVT